VICNTKKSNLPVVNWTELVDEAFQHYAGSKDYFLGLSKSVKKMILQWIVLAKRPDTRKKRIDEIAARAAEKDRPKQFQ
jgi:uncharacterized protein YdeI (YjbR/CyaY-like superfamily)